jgi:putative hydrolase of the HAD superfamily
MDDFTYVLSGDDIPERKPALHGFRKMIELSNLPPNEVMYVGDRVDVDIKPAKQLGMTTCLVYSQSDEADYSVESFPELTTIAMKNT